MAIGYDEVYFRICFGLGHQGFCLRCPVGPMQGPAPKFGIDYKADIAVIEPIPVFPTATFRWCVRRGLRIRKVEPPLIVPQVVAGRLLPLVIPPGRHIGRILRPEHDVVEMLVHRRQSVSITVGKVPNGQDKVRFARGDETLDEPHSRVSDRVANVGLRIHRKVGTSARRWRSKSMFGATCDRIVVKRILGQPREIRLPEGTGRGEGQRRRSNRCYDVRIGAG